ncbi:hypothetical protein [Gloeothece verrucosa]|uniref:Uncharacterized protein n=1 Tax=Gloeothece verrucosa (strain PCC 7822) TaxID=497965 RepID=E0UAE1_GLOV7|nr:hypothetical protein [Gloeothece verrucosa]ADN12682.1 conserved hypothetical protein [Gloeothece verrucosa PCC 7822]
MNIKAIIFSGIITALVGTMLGLAVSVIAQRPERKPVIIATGATLGFVIGSLQTIVRTQQEQREDDYQEIKR